MKGWRIKNRAKLAEYRRRYRAKHPEVIARVQENFYARHPDYQTQWHLERRDIRNERARQWHLDNPHKKREYRAVRRAVELMSMPPWVNREAIAAIYAEAHRRSMITGIPHEVDHVWPVKGDGFIGLTVPWNLRVITKAENRKKRNRTPKFQKEISNG